MYLYLPSHYKETTILKLFNRIEFDAKNILPKILRHLITYL